MPDTVPITIGGRELQLRLDLWAMREAERAVPNLNLRTGEGWERVSTSAEALLGVLWACLYKEDPRPTIDELGMALTPDKFAEVDMRLTILYAMSMAQAEDTEDLPPVDPTPGQETSAGPSSKPGDESTSASPAPSSGS